MADVTFGVKVPEEMKEELSELMKSSTLSGKEFMSLLISSYKLESKVENSDLFDSDLKELQNLLSRIQNLYKGMIEKSKIDYDDKSKLLLSQIDEHKEKEANSIIELESLKKLLEQKDTDISKSEKRHSDLEDKLNEVREENKSLKQQLKNNLLLSVKFEEELNMYKNQTHVVSELENDLAEAQKNSLELHQTINALHEDIKFSKYELKNKEDNILSLKKNLESQREEIESNCSLKLTNELLTEKIKYKEEESKLKEQINSLIQQNYQLEKNFAEKIESMNKNK